MNKQKSNKGKSLFIRHCRMTSACACSCFPNSLLIRAAGMSGSLPPQALLKAGKDAASRASESLESHNQN